MNDLYAIFLDMISDNEDTVGTKLIRTELHK